MLWCFSQRNYPLDACKMDASFYLRLINPLRNCCRWKQLSLSRIVPVTRNCAHLACVAPPGARAVRTQTGLGGTESPVCQYIYHPPYHGAKFWVLGLWWFLWFGTGTQDYPTDLYSRALKFPWHVIGYFRGSVNKLMIFFEYMYMRFWDEGWSD